MRQAEQPTQPSLRSRVFRRPSSRLGRVAAAGMAGAIVLVALVNAVGAQGTDDVPVWLAVVFVGSLVGLLVADVLGLVAVFRKRERSWVVLLPSALISAVIVNELIQGVLALLGLGE